MFDFQDAQQVLEIEVGSRGSLSPLPRELPSLDADPEGYAAAVAHSNVPIVPIVPIPDDPQPAGLSEIAKRRAKLQADLLLAEKEEKEEVARIAKKAAEKKRLQEEKAEMERQEQERKKKAEEARKEKKRKEEAEQRKAEAAREQERNNNDVGETFSPTPTGFAATDPRQINFSSPSTGPRLGK